MKAILTFVMALILSTATWAATVAKVDGPKGTILFYDQQCTGTPYFKWQMNGLDGKKVFEGCWFAYGTDVVVMEKSGQVIVIPVENLDQDPTT